MVCVAKLCITSALTGWSTAVTAAAGAAVASAAGASAADEDAVCLGALERFGSSAVSAAARFLAAPGLGAGLTDAPKLGSKK